MFMRRALASTYTDGWVRPKAGRSAGVNIPTWAHVSNNYGV